MLVLSRELDIVPFLEASVVLGRSNADITDSPTFNDMDEVFEHLSAADRAIGFNSRTEWGQRIVGRPPCCHSKSKR
uniref:Uncharacterized protein n=1 Tax=Candidatus Kentrum sp. TC TaxID=2126339 RepID=A0A450Z6Q5_9GAMM|nr:MAG: hypothetical protein BECKTC1821D_GA0114238_107913 [Candidatus Kentron sp. TC]